MNENNNFMYERFGSKIDRCMAIFCDEEKRNACHWHKEWEKTRSQVGCFFGKSECPYFKNK